MAYIKQTWIARAGKGLNRFKDKLTGKHLDLQADPEEITTEGTAFTADRMNHIENGIYTAQETASAALPLTGGVLTGDLHAPHYRTNVADGSYFLMAGSSGGKKIDYRLHANDGAFWVHRYENGQPNTAPIMITAAGYCTINGRAASAEWAERAGRTDTATTAEQIQSEANYIRPRWEGTVGVLDVDNAQDLAWNKARYLTPDSTTKTVAAEWALGTVWGFSARKDNIHPLGIPIRRWSTAYLGSSPIVTSDAREKHDIEALDTEKAAAFVAALKPAAYKYNDGTSGRTHWGLIAQDVEEAMEACGISDLEFAGLIKAKKTEDEQDKAGAGETETYSYSLRYEEFIAPLIALAQRQEKQIAALEKRLEKLETDCTDLKSEQ